MQLSTIINSALNKPLAFSLWLLAGLLIRIVYAVFFYRSLLEGDAYYYYEGASLLANGQFPGTYWPPGMAMYLALWIKVIGFSPIAAILGMLVIYLLFTQKFYQVANRFLDRAITTLGVAFFAIYPAFIHHSVAPLSHLPIALILLWLADELWKIHLAHQEGRVNWISWIVMGALFGVGGLIRPGILFVLPVVLIFALWQMKYKAYAFLGSLLIMSLFIGSWEVWAHRETDRWVSINDASAMNFYLGNNSHTPVYRTWWLGSQDERDNPQYREFYPVWDAIRAFPEEEQSSEYQQAALEHIKEDPGLFALRTLNRIRCFYAFDTFTGSRIYKQDPLLGTIFLILDALCFVLIGLLAIWGMIGKGTLMPFKIRRTWLWLILAYGIPYFLAFSHPTYHLPITPLLALFAGAAISKSDPAPFSFKDLPVSSRPFVYIAFLLFLYIQFEWIAQMVDRYVAVGGSF
ncbi:MAG: glycosyltransferase family 39 protein [Bacteroidia bacterium]